MRFIRSEVNFFFNYVFLSYRIYYVVKHVFNFSSKACLLTIKCSSEDIRTKLDVFFIFNQYPKALKMLSLNKQNPLLIHS